jgi:hypothetical protein
MLDQTVENIQVNLSLRNTSINRYASLHLWMIIPMVFMQLGIFRDYWGDFTDNAWSVHVHYLTGTVWYFYLIIQPYLATHGYLSSHKTNGIIGMFIAGGVCLTAFSMMNRDIVTTQRAAEFPDRFGPFQGWFFFGVAAVEIVMITAFGYAVIQSIIHRKRLEDHAWWLIATVFIIMMPALGRGIQNVHVALQRKNWPDIDIMSSLYLTEIIILAMIVLAAIKYDKLKHPATFLAVGVNLFNLLLEPLGRNKAVQSFLEAVIKG